MFVREEKRVVWFSEHKRSQNNDYCRSRAEGGSGGGCFRS